MPLPSSANLYPAGLLLLTVATGIVDAVSYLALDRVFTGNMTGNVLFIGVALVGVPEIPLLNNIVALAGFIAGSALGGRIIGRGHRGSLTRAGGCLLTVGALLTLVLAATWWRLDRLATPMLLTVTAALAALMGAQVAAVKPIGNSDITTVVVTSTLANLSRDSRLAGGRQPSRRAGWERLLAVLAMGVGAALGALVLRVANGPLALFLGGAVFGLGAACLALGRMSQRREVLVVPGQSQQMIV